MNNMSAIIEIGSNNTKTHVYKNEEVNNKIKEICAKKNKKLLNK